MTRVFVYGTLKRGGRNHAYLTGQQFISEARTTPGYTLYSLGDYPGMVRSVDVTNDVTGEIWEVDTACLARLDQLEGVAEGLYERVSIALAPPHSSLTAETYLYLRSVEGRNAIGSFWPK